MADIKTKKDNLTVPNMGTELNKPQTQPGTGSATAPNAQNKTEQAPREHYSETDTDSSQIDPLRQAAEKVQGWFPEEFSRDLDRRISEVSPISFFGLALASLGISAGLQMVEERKRWSTFFGLCVPSFLFLGIYSKLNSMQHGDSRTHSTDDDRPTVH